LAPSPVPAPRRATVVAAQEGELPVRVQDPQTDDRQIGDALFARGLLDLIDRQSFDGEDLLEWCSVLDDDHRPSFDQTFEPRRPERGVGEPDGEHRERRDGQHRPRHRAVVSGDSLLDQVPHHDQQDQLERRQFRELLASDRAADDPHEEEQGDGTHQDLHHGTTLVAYVTLTRG
jgi:hypothetical protein